MSEPIIDLQKDDYFMGEALRQAASRLLCPVPQLMLAAS